MSETDGPMPPPPLSPLAPDVGWRISLQGLSHHKSKLFFLELIFDKTEKGTHIFEILGLKHADHCCVTILVTIILTTVVCEGSRF